MSTNVFGFQAIFQKLLVWMVQRHHLKIYTLFANIVSSLVCLET